MPLIKIEHPENATWGVWEATESDDFFLGKLPPAYLTGYEPQRFSERRRKEFLASRWLLKQILKEDTVVFSHNENGKLKDAGGKIHFSLSHSGNRVAAIASEKSRVGVDIEEINPRVKKVMHKFLNGHESNLLGNNPDLWRITLCWSAKESIFKMAETPGMSFSKNMVLEVPQAECGKFPARALLGGEWKQIEMHFERSEGYVLTWCED